MDLGQRQQQSMAAVILRRVSDLHTELEHLPMETHQAIVSMLAQMFQHRALAKSREMEEKPKAAIQAVPQ